ncbi:MAG: anti-sigma factor [Acidobacteriota bacterium]|nr:anti-sigma factor [Acidobacteriota bacterium]MDE3043508.1 anti-sigma factor [Acidobacteriota bacterium]MDE3222954.1 anti-sigma factor [Acidobacteriota bacterium]
MNHEDAYELLELAALDAIDASTAVDLEEHVSGCSECQRELDAYRHVAATIGNAVEPLPERLWSSIADRLHERPVATNTAMPLLGGERTSLATPPMAPVISITTGRPSWTRRARGAVASAAFGAAAAIIALSVSLANANSHVAHLQGQISNGGQIAVASALETPGHVVVNLASATHRPLAQFVMLPSGQGYLVTSSLPKLSGDKTYQLWGIVKGQPVSLGVMGQRPSQVAFTMAGQVKPSELAVTVEPSGGSTAPSSGPVAYGTV